MPGIDKINRMLSRLRQQRTTTDVRRGTSSSTRPAKAQDINRSHQVELAQKLRTLDLRSTADRQRGRYIFVEHALALEFGGELLDLTAAHALVRKIEQQFANDVKLCNELDSLISELQERN